MNINDIKALAEILSNNGLTQLKIEENGTVIELKKEIKTKTVAQAPAVIPQMITDTKEPVKEAVVSSSKCIKSPTVGVFYSAPSPDSAPYVSAGDSVKEGSVVCIIEAMKLMNEIQAEFDCEIEEVLVKNGDVVEYDQPLFRIK